MERDSFKMFFNDKNGIMIEHAEAEDDLGENPADHLVEIFRRVIVTGPGHYKIFRDNDYSSCNINTLLSCCCCRCKDDPTTSNRKESQFYLLRSVTDLKSKGIHFRASQMQSLKGIRFHPSKFGLSAELQLPCLYVDMDTRVFFKKRDGI
ncbi:hypothetical protein H5410_015952 [Solanum commersonii]|uniref:Uncharacterized protein n=1 Tax=Solanum commersonii TaxID=4109 RepID=A0A9J5ZVA2_SOLCO|nr:hypothetical protein H5410_015952 [Solanum commersonii]